MFNCVNKHVPHPPGYVSKTCPSILSGDLGVGWGTHPILSADLRKLMCCFSCGLCIRRVEAEGVYRCCLSD